MKILYGVVWSVNIPKLPKKSQYSIIGYIISYCCVINSVDDIRIGKKYSMETLHSGFSEKNISQILYKWGSFYGG